MIHRSHDHFLAETSTIAGGGEERTMFCTLLWWNQERGVKSPQGGRVQASLPLLPKGIYQSHGTA